MPELILEIANDFAALGPASDRVREYLDGRGAPGAAAFLADLVIEELVTNSIKYGYDDAAQHSIRVGVDFHDDQLRVEVCDDGHAFNPLEQAAPDITVPAEERAIGGLGIHLVRQMTDDVRYERRGASNIVTATKTFPPAAEA
ncbi:MAG: ATP-binding protein [Terrimicrobiaceae bacterium]|nr:ATP-binding protein [Terrimicrobiaceae bacterium]